MKKSRFLFLLLVLTGVLLAGCSGEAAEDAVKVVRNTDELIAAIAPDTEIQLAEGNFLLSDAATYGKRTGNPYVRWEDPYGSGAHLSIHDVDNLTIRGSGADKTKLLAKSANVDVLEFIDCANITLEGFTGGHTPQDGGCSAGVLRLFRCENLLLHQLGLFGCGANGVSAQKVNNLTVADCEIYDCSMGGMYLTDCCGVDVTGCSFRGIGLTNDWYADTLLSLSQCYDISVSQCSFTKNSVQELVNAYETRALTLKDNCFVGNTAVDGMFLLTSGDAVVETDNVFTDNVFSRWYGHTWGEQNSGFAVNENGEPAFPEDPEPIASESVYTEPSPVISVEQTCVQAATVDELLAAIAPNTEIILTGELYDLTTASDYGSAGGKYYYWEESFDGPQLVISGVENFSIISADNDRSLHTITAAPRYANVLVFRKCTNVALSGFTAGHTVEPGFCSGGVLLFEEDTANVLIDNCDLYGCGTLGVWAFGVSGLQVLNSAIHECTYGGIQCFNCNGLTVGGCTFWELGGDTFQLNGCENVIVNGQEIPGSYQGN